MLRAPATCTAGMLALALQPFVVIAAPQEATPDVVIDSQLDGSNLPPYTIALTYDDGPDALTLPLAQYLHDQGIKATFFVNGCRIQGSPAPSAYSGNCIHDPPYPQYPASTLQQLIDLGHRVANNTEDHVDLTTPGLTSQAILSQLSVLEFGNGTSPSLDAFIRDGFCLFRPPYTWWTPSTAAAVRTDSRLDKLSGPFYFTLGGRDWSCFAPTPTIALRQTTDARHRSARNRY